MSSLLSNSGHKAFHVPHRGLHSPLQVCSPLADHTHTAEMVLITHTHTPLLSPAAQFLGGGDMCEGRGAGFSHGAEP